MAKSDKHTRYCMFCGRSEKEVPLLLQGMDACICSDCIKMAQDYIDEVNAPLQILIAEIVAGHSHRKLFTAKIYCISTILYGGNQLVIIPCRGKYFRFFVQTNLSSISICS